MNPDWVFVGQHACRYIPLYKQVGVFSQAPVYVFISHSFSFIFSLFPLLHSSLLSPRVRASQPTNLPEPLPLPLPLPLALPLPLTLPLFIYLFLSFVRSFFLSFVSSFFLYVFLSLSLSLSLCT